MILLFYRFFGSIFRIFSGKNLWVHLAAILVTIMLVTSGFDGWYYHEMHRSRVATFLFRAVIAATFLPVLLPVFLLIVGYVARRIRWACTGWMLGQAALLGWLITSFYKVFTGRPGPHFHGGAVQPDISRVFRFGFWRGGIFWGWPSSHTAVAFAMAFSLVYLYPGDRKIRWLAPAYAVIVAAGVSMSIHWFSDVVAGAMLGWVIGSVAGTSFREKIALTQPRSALRSN